MLDVSAESSKIRGISRLKAGHQQFAWRYLDSTLWNMTYFCFNLDTLNICLCFHGRIHQGWLQSHCCDQMYRSGIHMGFWFPSLWVIFHRHKCLREDMKFIVSLRTATGNNDMHFCHKFHMQAAILLKDFKSSLTIWKRDEVSSTGPWQFQLWVLLQAKINPLHWANPKWPRVILLTFVHRHAHTVSILKPTLSCKLSRSTFSCVLIYPHRHLTGSLERRGAKSKRHSERGFTFEAFREAYFRLIDTAIEN